MPNNGTGQPINFRCTKCRSTLHENSNRGWRLAATGRRKPLSKAQRGHGGARVTQCRIEYRCLDCGHVGWTRHKQAENLKVQA